MDVGETIMWAVASIVAGSLVYLFTIGLVALALPHPWDTIVGVPGLIVCWIGAWVFFDQQ